MIRKDQKIIAIINSTVDIVDIFTDCLEAEGFNCAGGLIPEFKRGHRDFVQFMTDHDPALIIWDLAPPYEQNVVFLRMVQNLKIMENRRWIFTTTNKEALKKFTSDIAAYEIIGKPMDIEVLIEAVKKVMAE